MQCDFDRTQDGRLVAVCSLSELWWWWRCISQSDRLWSTCPWAVRLFIGWDWEITDVNCIKLRSVIVTLFWHMIDQLLNILCSQMSHVRLARSCRPTSWRASDVCLWIRAIKQVSSLSYNYQYWSFCKVLPTLLQGGTKTAHFLYALTLPNINPIFKIITLSESGENLY